MTKRYLLSAAIFFAAGTVINVLEISLFLILAEGLFVTVFILLFRRKYAVLCVVMFFFMALGMVRMEISEQKRLATVNRYHGTTKYLEMVATDFSDEEKVIVKFSDGKNSGKAYLSLDEGTELCPGQIISGRVKLTEPYYSKVALSDFSSYLCSRGVYLSARGNNLTIKDTCEGGLWGMIYSFRRYMDSAGKSYIRNENTRALYNAMVFGDKHLISERMLSAFQAAGLNHIAVVSGMHLSIIMAAVMFLMRKTFGKK